MDDPNQPKYDAEALAETMELKELPEDGIVLSKNVQRTLDIVNEITTAIAKNGMTDVVTGFGVLNEPFANCDMAVVRKFDNLALDIVRRNMGEHTSIYIGDIFNATKWNDGWWTEEKYKNTYLDSHYYHVFDERPRLVFIFGRNKCKTPFIFDSLVHYFNLFKAPYSQRSHRISLSEES